MLTDITFKMKKIVGLTAYSNSDLTTEILVDLYYSEKLIVAYAKDNTIDGVLEPSKGYITENLNSYSKSDCEYTLKYWVLPTYMVREDGNTDAFYIKDNEIFANFGYSSEWSCGFDNNIIDKIKELNLLPSKDELNPYEVEIVNGSNSKATFTYNSIEYTSNYSENSGLFTCSSITPKTEEQCIFYKVGVKDTSKISSGFNIGVPGTVGMIVTKGSDANEKRVKITPKTSPVLFTVYGVKKIEV